MSIHSPHLPVSPEGRLEERFEEKNPPYDDAEAIAEANRCLYCVDAPCIKACPTAIDIPTFIRKIATGNVKGAARTILSQNLLGKSCGQVCPVEVLCAGACVYNDWEREPIRIGRLQRYAVETAIAKDPALYQAKPQTGKRVALIGAGPASIAAAGWLALEGHEAVIYERKELPGGLNTLGIAPYKMKVEDSIAEISWVLSLGNIELFPGVEVVDEVSGQGQISTQELLEKYDAVFLGLGLGADSKLNVPGENGEGVVGATHLIERLKADPSLRLDGVKRAIIVGGGNTAIDIAHELSLLGIDATMVYRGPAADMSAYEHEMLHGRADGVKVATDRVPVAVVRDEKERVCGLRVARAENKRPVPGTEEELPADLIVLAVGQNRATAIARAFPGIELDGRGRVVVDAKTGRTGNPRVWSGGDCVNGGKEVVNAVAEARVAAQSIHAFLAGA
ncbi:FAD-dependent oxidoreductase [Polyangium aurulentum]|uniref:FAD-dependent oxidoreductase n=1 Tax=Polyangium aurulentum TaxID=2567896 RepID=UPI0010AED94E|nr:FAD-dependent oxidoreductase [Polyangium aurulentum]UQA60236.1 FAD-dependent oxidoreductase [Polyangium aurulentum]